MFSPNSVGYSNLLRPGGVEHKHSEDWVNIMGWNMRRIQRWVRYALNEQCAKRCWCEKCTLFTEGMRDARWRTERKCQSVTQMSHESKNPEHECWCAVNHWMSNAVKRCHKCNLYRKLKAYMRDNNNILDLNSAFQESQGRFIQGRGKKEGYVTTCHDAVIRTDTWKTVFGGKNLNILQCNLKN